MFIFQALLIAAALLVPASFATPAPAITLEQRQLKSFIAFNERVVSPNWNETLHFEQLRRRAEPWSASHPGLQAAIDAAVRTTIARPHFFWSGRTLPATSDDDSVFVPAQQLAKKRGGTTLELTLEGVNMPDFTDAGGDDIWQYASDVYASMTKGDAYFAKGESLRPGNVWEVYEFPRLKKSAAVKRIYEILMHKSSVEQPVQIFPELAGCDGVTFVERQVNCLAGSKLFYGSANSPVVTAKTNVAAETAVKVSASGNAAGIVRECTEIISADFITTLFKSSGVCEAATAKANGGKVMNEVKKLLASPKNRNYVQRRGIREMKERVLGTPVMFDLTRSLLDSLVSIDYYAKTHADTAAVVSQIDKMVQTATGKSPGLTAAWSKKSSTLPSTKAKLLAELKKQIAQKQKEAKEAAARAAACGGAPSTGKPATPKPAPAPSKPRMTRRALSAFSPAQLSSLQLRAPRTAPRSGAKAPPAPSCPLPGAKPKKVVPRSKVKAKPVPKTAPKKVAGKPKPKAPTPKKTVRRPANRPRRTPGKPAAPKKRVTPKKVPRKVPKPATKAKGKPRGRGGRR